jgi:hypothetical protein
MENMSIDVRIILKWILEYEFRLDLSEVSEKSA